MVECELCAGSARVLKACGSSVVADGGAGLGEDLGCCTADFTALTQKKRELVNALTIA